MKKLFCTLLVFVSMNACAGEWITDAKSGCQAWQYLGAWAGNSFIWTGTCTNNKATGNGVLQWYVNGEPRTRYEGEIRDGYMQGKGTYTFIGHRPADTWPQSPASGTNWRYEGAWSNGKISGFGVMQRIRRIDRDTQAGIWEDGELVRSCATEIQCANDIAAENATQRQADADKRAYEIRTVAFRKQVQSGDDTTSGVVIEVKGNLIKIQTDDSQCSQRDYNGNCTNYINTPSEKWVKRSEIYPK